MKRKIIAFMVVLALSMSLIGCATSGKGEPTPVSNDKKTLKVVVAYGGKEKIFDAFAKDTGIKVEFLNMSSGEVLARATVEGGKPMADVWFGGGIDSFISAKEKELLEKYESKEAAVIPQNYRDKDGYWSGVSLVMVGFITNRDILKEKGLPVPKTWEDLKDPKYKEEVLMADPGISGTNYAMVGNILQTKGNEAGWQYIVELTKNVPYFSKTGGEPPTKVAAGEAGVAIIPLSGEFFALKDKAPVDIIFPQDGIPWVPAGLAIFKNAQNLDSAKVFVDWALSEKGQKIIFEADQRIMVRPGAPVPDMLKSFSQDKLMNVNIEALGTQRKEILATWDAKIGKK